ncbi:GGDEF domain-containing protein [Streptomyces gamaensis]|uniref:GGDEF domain-containing protein n=1 Tax=Streptomyces gamaensis TaxID=1763542 RepID=A0ABW0YWR3_9ACTN
MTALVQALPIAAPLAGWAAHALYLARRLRTARTDPLTGLMCRDEFTVRARRAVRHPHAVVVLLDLDDFKSVNDTYGHAAGDDVLAATGERLADWAEYYGGFAARLGGDEFAAVIRLAPDTPMTTVMTDGLMPQLAEVVAVRDEFVWPRASVGLCRTVHRPGVGLPQLLRGADEAMYRAKELGLRWQTAHSVDVHPTANGRRTGRPGTSRAATALARKER